MFYEPVIEGWEIQSGMHCCRCGAMDLLQAVRKADGEIGYFQQGEDDEPEIHSCAAAELATLGIAERIGP